MARQMYSKSRGFTIIVSESRDGRPLSGWERNMKFYWRGHAGLNEGTYRNAATAYPQKAIGIHADDWREV